MFISCQCLESLLRKRPLLNSNLKCLLLYKPNIAAEHLMLPRVPSIISIVYHYNPMTDVAAN